MTDMRMTGKWALRAFVWWMDEVGDRAGAALVDADLQLTPDRQIAPTMRDPYAARP